MYVTTEQLENELVDFFNQFVDIAIQKGLTKKDGFDIRNINGNNIRFIIFDKPWDDDSKQIIWEETYSTKGLCSLNEIKTKITPHIGKSIQIFTETKA